MYIHIQEVYIDIHKHSKLCKIHCTHCILTEVGNSKMTDLAAILLYLHMFKTSLEKKVKNLFHLTGIQCSSV